MAELRYLQVAWVEVSLVLVCGFVSSMSVLDHRVQQVFEDFVCLLIPSNTAHSHNEGVACTWSQQGHKRPRTAIYKQTSSQIKCALCRQGSDWDCYCTRIVNPCLNDTIYGEAAGCSPLSVSCTCPGLKPWPCSCCADWDLGTHPQLTASSGSAWPFCQS